MSLKSFFRYTFLLLGLLASTAATLYFLDHRGFFQVDHIEIVMLKNTEQPRFMRPLVEELDHQLEKARGRSLWRIDLDTLGRQIQTLPWVQEMQIRRNWPDRLEVRLVPKEVKFLFVGKGGALFPVLGDGTFLNPVAVENMPDVVLLRGDEFVQNKELLMRALALLDQIPRDGSFSKRTISEIRFDSKEGFSATLMKRAVRVKLGEDQIVLKSERLSQVVDYLEAHEFDARVIDANLTKKVLVRLRKDP